MAKLTETPLRRVRLLGFAALLALAVGFTAGWYRANTQEALDAELLPAATPTPAPTATPEPTSTPAPTPTPEPTPTATPVPLRSALIVGEVVDVRQEPALGGEVVGVVDGSFGRPVEVESSITPTGWYRVRYRADGQMIEGWVFGAHIVPADSGWLVVENRDEDAGALTLYRDVEGEGRAGRNPTEPFALVVDSSQDRWLIRLPDGGEAYIDPAGVRPRT